MELRLAASACLLLGCASEPMKRLVIPEEMRRPLATGQSVGEASAGNAQGSKITGVDWAIALMTASAASTNSRFPIQGL